MNKNIKNEKFNVMIECLNRIGIPQMSFNEFYKELEEHININQIKDVKTSYNNTNVINITMIFK